MTNMETLLHRLVAAPDYYALDIKHKERVVSACREFLDTLVRLQSDDTLSRALWHKIEEVLGRFGDASLFVEVSPASRINLEYQQNLARVWQRFSNTNAIHLEL